MGPRRMSRGGSVTPGQVRSHTQGVIFHSLYDKSIDIKGAVEGSTPETAQ